MDARQDVLIDMTPYLPTEDTLLAAIEETEAEQAAAIERAAALVAAEETERAKGIRAMITADMPNGAAGRWAVMFATDTVEEIAEEVAEETREFAVFNTARGPIRVHAADCADVARDRKRYGTPEIIRAADQATIVADFMSDFIEEGCAPEDLDGDFVWVSCCGDLPWAADSGTQTESESAVDIDALQMTPMIRQMLADLDGRRWHYQTRKGALDKGLIVDISASALTPFGEQVRAALVA